MEDIYYHEVRYKWTFKRGNATYNTYKKDYAISVATTIEELNKDIINQSMAKGRFGIKDKKLLSFEITEILNSKVVGQTNEE